MLCFSFCVGSTFCFEFSLPILPGHVLNLNRYEHHIAHSPSQDVKCHMCEVSQVYVHVYILRIRICRFAHQFQYEYFKVLKDI